MVHHYTNANLLCARKHVYVYCTSLEIFILFVYCFVLLWFGTGWVYTYEIIVFHFPRASEATQTIHRQIDHKISLRPNNASTTNSKAKRVAICRIYCVRVSSCNPVCYIDCWQHLNICTVATCDHVTGPKEGFIDTGYECRGLSQ